MKNWSIQTQIRAGMLCVLGLLVSLATIGLVGNWLVAAAFSDYRHTAHSTAVTTELLEEVFEARLAAMKYRYNPDPEGLETLVGAVDLVMGEGERIDELLGADSAGAAAYATLHEQMDDYRQRMGRAAGLQERREKLVAEISKLGPTARMNVTEVMSSARAMGNSRAGYAGAAVQQDLLLGRFYMERFLVDNTLATHERAMRHLTASLDRLDRLLSVVEGSDRHNLILEADDIISRYIEVADELKKVILFRNAEYAAMDKIGPAAVAGLEHLNAELGAERDVVGARAEALAFWSLIATMILGVIGVIAGVLASQKISGSIVRNIAASVGTMSELANGNLKVEVAGTEREDELGRMAQALEVFKARGLEAERLQAEKAKADAKAEEMRAAQAERDAEAARAREAQMAAKAEQAEREREKLAEFERFQVSVSEVISRAVGGDFTGHVSENSSDDGLVKVATEINRLMDEIGKALKATNETIRDLAEGLLTARMAGDYDGEFAALQTNLNGSLGTLEDIVLRISAAGANVSDLSGEVRNASDLLARQTENNAASLAEAAASLHQLTESIRGVSTNVQQATSGAEAARQTALESGQVAENAVDAMTDISQASNRITSALKIIEDISFQINLLALNAGVEAARAGDAGRGFSVVASEVRALAQRSSEAVVEISQVASENRAVIERGVGHVTEAKASQEKIIESVLSISGQMSEIGQAINEQTIGIGEINHAVAVLDTSTQANAAAFEQLAALGNNLAGEAQELAGAISNLKVGDGSGASRAHAA
ncbi:methyl-accepting chemotaxis protein [Amaricoccus macauensis]|uniref:methyl-accepting chemotaxis protein n=1 Tax=Amaricoccus macauensis TaxID=57001 RepID=UPI003C7CCD0A